MRDRLSLTLSSSVVCCSPIGQRCYSSTAGVRVSPKAGTINVITCTPLIRKTSSQAFSYCCKFAGLLSIDVVETAPPLKRHEGHRVSGRDAEYSYRRTCQNSNLAESCMVRAHVDTMSNCCLRQVFCLSSLAVAERSDSSWLQDGFI